MPQDEKLGVAQVFGESRKFSKFYRRAIKEEEKYRQAQKLLDAVEDSAAADRGEDEVDLDFARAFRRSKCTNSHLRCIALSVSQFHPSVLFGQTHAHCVSSGLFKGSISPETFNVEMRASSLFIRPDGRTGASTEMIRIRYIIHYSATFSGCDGGENRPCGCQHRYRRKNCTSVRLRSTTQFLDKCVISISLASTNLRKLRSTSDNSSTFATSSLCDSL